MTKATGFSRLRGDVLRWSATETTERLDLQPSREDGVLLAHVLYGGGVRGLELRAPQPYIEVLSDARISVISEEPALLLMTQQPS